ncbi:MAG TPA: ABC transporter substrate-binding protein [Steroidobacteraceae bacterium]|jgi:NitT/TauT family transport system substrate-binding protein|nr:ABC transporter substrate-binding protein [Steroidobacteraceae bacterium]
MKRYAFVGWVAALIVIGMPQARGAAEQVSLGVVNWIGYGPLYCAAANGYYRKYGWDVKLVTFSDNSLMTGALEGGELGASTLTYDQVLIAVAKGWKLKVVMPIDYSAGGDAILSKVSIRTVKDLKGRTVAFQPSSPSDFLLGYALAQAGLSQSDVRAVNSTPEGVVAIMASGSVDAGVTYEPSVSMIQKIGGGNQFHVLLSSRDARGLITDVLAFREDTIAKNPKMIQALIRGGLDGLDFMGRQPDQAAVIIGKALGISVADVKAQLLNVENPHLAQLGDVFKKASVLPSFHASGNIIGGILKREGQIQKLPPIEATYDASFVTALQAQAGGLQ